MNWKPICILFWIALVYNVRLLGAEQINWNDEQKGISVHLTTVSNVHLNDELPVEIIFSYPDDYQFDPETLIQALLWTANPLDPQWELVKDSTTTTHEEGKNKTTMRLVLAPRRAGELFLSLFDIAFQAPSGRSETLSVPVFKITVHQPELPTFNLQESLKLLPLEPQHPLGLSVENQLYLSSPAYFAAKIKHDKKILEERSFPWKTLLAVILLAFAFAIWRYFGRYEFFQKPIKQISPQEKAFTDLKILHSQNLPEKGLYKEFYLKLTEILRTYLEKEYKIPATSQTTEEFFDGLSISTLSVENQKILKNILHISDRIKFAMSSTTIEQCEEAYRDVVNFINRSKVI